MSSKTKRFLVTVCAMCLVASLFAGCGAEKEENTSVTQTSTTNVTQDQTKEVSEVENQTIEVAMFEGGYSGFWRDYIKVFQDENPGVTIKSEINPKIADVLRPRFMSGDVPDIVASNITPALDPRVLGKEGQLLDITDFMDQTTTEDGTKLKDAFWPGVLDVATIEGKVYFAPSNSSYMGTFYNAKLLKDLGVAVPTTFDEVLEIGEKIRAKGDKSISLFTYAGIYPGYFSDMTLYTTIASGTSGYSVFDKMVNNEAGAWKSPEVVKALNYLEIMAKNKDIVPGTTAINHTQSQQNFLTGKVAFIPNGNWLENEMEDTELENFEWGFIPTLKLEATGKSYLSGGVEGIYIPAKAKNPEMAKKFLEGYYNLKTVKEAAKYGAVVPLNGVIGHIEDFLSPSIVAILSAQEEANAEFKIMAIPTEIAEVKTEFENAITDIVNLKSTAEEAAAKIDKVAAGISK